MDQNLLTIVLLNFHDKQPHFQPFFPQLYEKYLNSQFIWIDSGQVS